NYSKRSLRISNDALGFYKHPHPCPLPSEWARVWFRNVLRFTGEHELKLYCVMAMTMRSLILSVLICFIGHVPEARPAQSSGNVGWELEWERTIKAAEQEGEVSYYTLGEYGFLQEFEKKFHRIKVKVVPGRGSDLLSRIMT